MWGVRRKREGDEVGRGGEDQKGENGRERRVEWNRVQGGEGEGKLGGMEGR